MLRTIGRFVGWVLVGLAGTVAVFASTALYMKIQVPVNLRSGGNVFTSNWDNGFVHASGTWVIENDRQAFPLQVAEVLCRRSDSECTSATAEVTFGGLLNVDTDRYEVVRWTTDTIIFTTSALCVDYTYTISRASERLVGTRTPKRAGSASCPSGAGKDTLQLSLKDGFKVQMGLEDEARSRAQPFLWAGLTVLWLFIAMRVFRRRASSAKASEATA
jgi:hypothetical protein